MCHPVQYTEIDMLFGNEEDSFEYLNTTRPDAHLWRFDGEAELLLLLRHATQYACCRLVSRGYGCHALSRSSTRWLVKLRYNIGLAPLLEGRLGKPTGETVHVWNWALKQPAGLGGSQNCESADSGVTMGFDVSFSCGETLIREHLFCHVPNLQIKIEALRAGPSQPSPLTMIVVVT